MRVALSTDCNPGTCNTENVFLMGTIASSQMGMRVDEVVRALTIEAAHAVGLAHDIGSLEPGKRADLVVLDATSHLSIPYHWGIDPVAVVVKDGQIVCERGDGRHRSYGRRGGDPAQGRTAMSASETRATTANRQSRRSVFHRNSPRAATFAPGIRRAPSRGYDLSPAETVLAVKNALRYVPAELHAALAPEFLAELRTYGRIYAYRYRPQGEITARPLDDYEGIPEARALQLNIDNNLDFAVALYPYELVTYGETGQVFQNWLQYQLVTRYLRVMSEEQTLVIASGHPVGLFPTHRNAPRVINTNGLMVGEFDNAHDFHRATQLGVANYGQMTAGGWMYIGPQGIVHGTYITLMNAGRLYLGLPDDGRPGRGAVPQLGTGGHERRPAQGGRHRRCGQRHRRGRLVAHPDPPGPGVGAACLGRPGRGLRLGRRRRRRAGCR